MQNLSLSREECARSSRFTVRPGHRQPTHSIPEQEPPVSPHPGKGRAGSADSRLSGLVPPPPFGGSFRGETGCCVWHVGGGEASAVMPRQALEPVCPRVSLGPSRRSFIGEARASVRRALPQVRVHVTAPSRAEAVASKEVST